VSNLPWHKRRNWRVSFRNHNLAIVLIVLVAVTVAGVSIVSHLDGRYKALHEAEMSVFQRSNFGAPGTTLTDWREGTFYMRELRRVK